MAIQRLSLFCFSKCRSILFFAFLSLVSVGLLSGQVIGQTADQNSKDEKTAKFASQLWDYLLANNYKHWSPGVGRTINHFSNQQADLKSYNSANPHGAYLKSYMNRKAAGNPSDLPVGSIVILENYRSDKSLESISVMYRSPGFNPSANDWFWVKYNADGSVASLPNQTYLNANGVQQTFASNSTGSSRHRLMGRASSCIACHKQSGGRDLAFFNDRQTRNNSRLTMSEEFSK
ncbi:MAG: hypothetical protein AB8B55_15710 [Mariniblastus sp.]